ncbi:hypothetical protein ABK040_013856 [Willaertia magna]
MLKIKEQLYLFVDIQEHTYSLDVLSKTYFPHSNIDLNNLDQSFGIKTKQIELLTKEGASNYIERPEQVSFCFCLRTRLTLEESLLIKFLDILPEKATVRRQGEVKEIDTRDVVYGDVVLLKAGQIVPADCRIIQVDNMVVDVSSLRGRNFPPMEVTTEETDILPLKTKNLVFAGYKVISGSAIGIAIAVGKRCVQIRMAEYICSQPKKKQKLTKKKSRSQNKLTKNQSSKSSVVTDTSEMTARRKKSSKANATRTGTTPTRIQRKESVVCINNI